MNSCLWFTKNFGSWDIETSGQTNSQGGIGKPTVEMQTASTFLEAGWVFIDEIANGSEDVWWILEGQPSGCDLALGASNCYDMYVESACIAVVYAVDGGS